MKYSPLLIVNFLFFAVSTFIFAEVSTNKRIYTTSRLDQNSPQIDGKLDDSAWQSVPKNSDFTQHKPNDGEKPSEQTEFQIAYDDQFLYVAIRAWDSQLGIIDNRVTRRDEIENSDGVGILLTAILTSGRRLSLV